MLPDPPPLMTGPITGHSHPRCYASASTDCSAKLSNEHALGQEVLNIPGDLLTVKGMAWQKGETSELRAKALGAKILCDRHNSALSPLDAMAADLFRTLRCFQREKYPDAHLFALFDGRSVERWVLKMLWGLTFSGQIGKAGVAISPPADDLLPVLFRGAEMPKGWGLFIEQEDFKPAGAMSVAPMIDAAGKIVGGDFCADYAQLRLVLGHVSPDLLVHRRPSFLQVAHVEIPGHQWPCLAFSWPTRGNEFTLKITPPRASEASLD